ncbi:MAG: folate-binding protein [Pseudomonadota bacterium]|nr:folate-binding protein [Pseudomonadota bacterium]
MSESVSALSNIAVPNGIAPLPHLGVIRAKGDDAAKFLQGQLTQDVVLMQPGEARLAAFCNAKGRMQASFQVLKTAPDELLLITSADTLPATLKRLSMFVLRARLKLSDATSDFSVWGQLGKIPDSIAFNADAASSKDQNEPENRPHRIALPPAGNVARTLWLAPAGGTVPADVAQLAEADWLLAEALAGVARITRPVAEAFVPQMLNYESVGGVNFKKGCYPGQEVVARSQFRGAIKRRAYVGRVDGAAQAGQEVFSATDPGQPVGQIAQAATAPDGGAVVIAVLQVAEATATDAALRVGGVEGPPVSGLHIPYPLDLDI